MAYRMMTTYIMVGHIYERMATEAGLSETEKIRLRTYMNLSGGDVSKKREK